MLPRSLIAFSRDIKSHISSFLAIAERKLAFTYAASSTPGGTRLANSSIKNSASPSGGCLMRDINSAVSCALSGLGGIEFSALSKAFFRYVSNSVFILCAKKH